MKFACGHGHTVTAEDANGTPIDLANFFCPVCLGEIQEAGEVIDLRFLAPKQEKEAADVR